MLMYRKSVQTKCDGIMTIISQVQSYAFSRDRGERAVEKKGYSTIVFETFLISLELFWCIVSPLVYLYLHFQNLQLTTF